MSPLATQPPDLGAYACSRRLGRGGDAEVWAATEPLTGRPLAVKVLRPERASAGQVPRLLREYQFLRDLGVAGLPRVRGLGVTRGGRHYLVMDRLEGAPSTTWIERSTTPTDRIVRSLAVLARAGRLVADVHDAGVLHGDLKPSSLLVSEGDRVWLLDFGAARPRDASRLLGTIPESFLTRAFAAPELLRRREPCDGSDVWALSAIACRLILGEPPFGRGTRAELRARMTASAVDGLRAALARQVPEAAVAAITAGLAWEPARRPSARAWAEAVGSAIGGHDVGCAPLSEVIPPARVTAASTPRDAGELGRTIAERARALLDSGAWSEARRVLVEHEERCREPLDRTHLLLALAELEIGLEHFAVASDAIAIATGIAHAHGLGPTSVLALRALAGELQLCLALARPAPLEAAARCLASLPVDHALVPLLSASLALALADAGDPSAAHAHAARALEAAARLDDVRAALIAKAAAVVVAEVSGQRHELAPDAVEAKAAALGLWPALIRLALARGDEDTAWDLCARMLPGLAPAESMPLRLSQWAVAVAARRASMPPRSSRETGSRGPRAG